MRDRIILVVLGLTIVFGGMWLALHAFWVFVLIFDIIYLFVMGGVLVCLTYMGYHWIRYGTPYS